jgi:hypothetical protein
MTTQPSPYLGEFLETSNHPHIRQEKWPNSVEFMNIKLPTLDMDSECFESTRL